MKISTHAPLAGRDWLTRSSYSLENATFQPTRPLRGATNSAKTAKLDTKFQPTRPLRGATDEARKSADKCAFQPTRPLRGAT